MDAGPVLDRIAALDSARAFVLVGIGGHGGAGKSTLARAIPGAQVVGTDEFWDGTEFELSRLRAEVIEPLLRGESPEYRGFSWELQRRLPEPRAVRPEGVIVVEGVCALHQMFREAYDLRIWVDAPRELRLARGIARDGEGAREIWENQWMPSEDRYVERDDPISAADLILDGFQANRSAVAQRPRAGFAMCVNGAPLRSARAPVTVPPSTPSRWSSAGRERHS
jgi:uridine kinase